MEDHKWLYSTSEIVIWCRGGDFTADASKVCNTSETGPMNQFQKSAFPQKSLFLIYCLSDIPLLWIHTANTVTRVQLKGILGER